jgi:uncharacterized membrane protein YvlD (DUF360 family)
MPAHSGGMAAYMAENYQHAETRQFSITHFIIRLIVSMVVLGITAALTPGFAIRGLWSLFAASLVLSLLDYLVQKVFKADASPFGRGITGFILAAVIIYAARFFVPGYYVTITGALLGALVYGIVDLIIPGKAM